MVTVESLERRLSDMAATYETTARKLAETERLLSLSHQHEGAVIGRCEMLERRLAGLIAENNAFRETRERDHRYSHDLSRRRLAI